MCICNDVSDVSDMVELTCSAGHKCHFDCIMQWWFRKQYKLPVPEPELPVPEPELLVPEHIPTSQLPVPEPYINTNPGSLTGDIKSD